MTEAIEAYRAAATALLSAVARIEAALQLLQVDPAWPEGDTESSRAITLSDLHEQMELIATTLTEIVIELEARLAVRSWENG